MDLRWLAPLLVTAVLLAAGCGSSGSGGGSSPAGGAGGGGKASKGPLTDASTCTDWDHASIAARHAYTKPLQPQALSLNIYNYVRDTCGGVIGKQNSDALVLGQITSGVVNGR